MVENVSSSSPQRKQRRQEVGVVTRAHRTPKTLRVEVEYRIRHPQYGKYLRRRQVLHVHDEHAQAKEGDRVQVVQCRRLSKTKSWRLVKVLASTGQAGVPAGPAVQNS